MEKEKELHEGEWWVKRVMGAVEGNPCCYYVGYDAEIHKLELVGLVGDIVNESRSRFKEEVVKVLQDCIEENKKMDDRSQREYLTLYPIQEAIEIIKFL